MSGDNQCGPPGAPLPEPLVVRVLGPRSRDFLGRMRSSLPVAGQDVTFQLEDLGPDAELAVDPPGGLPRFPVLLASPDAAAGEEPHRVVVKTDASGLARVFIRLGTENGDFRVQASVERPDRKPLKDHFRVLSGVVKELERTEALAGDEVPLKLRVVRRGADGSLEPLADREVYIRVVGEPGGAGERAEIKNRRDRTDKDGVRKNSSIVLGDRPGVYQVLAEIETRPEERPLRGILMPIVAMDWVFTGLRVLAGVLLFLLGVRFVGNGFLLILSPYLHLPAGLWGGNRVSAYLGGVLSGATFESSSTVVSYLTSFANGGVLTARQAAGVVAGASLGATLLPQLLSLNLDFLLGPLLGAGLVLLVLPRGAGLNSWGWVFLGAGLLLGGWTLLSDCADIVALSENFRRHAIPPPVSHTAGAVALLGGFGSYLAIGLAAGLLLRTSNLVVILAILLASKGVFTPATGVPLVIGANAGAALHLFLRAAFKLREARRVAAVHLVLQLAGVLLVSVLALLPLRGSSVYLHLVEWLTPGRLFHPIAENVEHHLATAHSLFNLLAGLTFLLVPSWVLRATDRVVPPRTADDDVKPYHLDDNLLSVPALALRQARHEVVYLTEICRKMIAEAFDSFRYRDLRLSDHVVRRDGSISTIHRDLARYLLQVGENQLSRRSSMELEFLQVAASNLERIAESGERLRELTGRRLDEGVDSSEEIDRDLNEVYDLVMAQFDNILTLLEKNDSRVQENAVKMVERLAKIRSRLESYWRQRIEHGHQGGSDPVRLHVETLLYQEAFVQLFRVAGHLAHIAQHMRILSPGGG